MQMTTEVSQRKWECEYSSILHVNTGVYKRRRDSVRIECRCIMWPEGGSEHMHLQRAEGDSGI